MVLALQGHGRSSMPPRHGHEDMTMLPIRLIRASPPLRVISASPRSNLPIEQPVTDRFRDMPRRNRFFAREVSNRAAGAADLVVGAG